MEPVALHPFGAEVPKPSKHQISNRSNHQRAKKILDRHLIKVLTDRVGMYYPKKERHKLTSEKVAINSTPWNAIERNHPVQKRALLLEKSNMLTEYTEIS